MIRNIVFGHISVDSEAWWWSVDKAQSSWIIKGTFDTNNLVLDGGGDVEAGSSNIIDWCLNTSGNSISIIVSFDNIAKSTTWWGESSVNGEFKVIEALWMGFTIADWMTLSANPINSKW